MSCKGLRGILVDAKNDGTYVFRVFNGPDKKTFVDYELRVDDLNIEITSDYYRLVRLESGVAYIDYRRGHGCGDHSQEQADGPEANADGHECLNEG